MLKSSIPIIFIVSFLNTSVIWGQQELPNISLRNSSKTTIKVDEIGAEKITIMAFWATWCAPCIEELDALNDLVENDPQKENYSIYIVSIDDNRTVHKVNAVVNSHNWNFNLLFDTNHELKKALNINDTPYTIIIENHAVIKRHTGYYPGYEEDLIAFINQQLSKNE